MPKITNTTTNQDDCRQMYAVEVLETLSRMVYVKAQDLDEAIYKVQDLYRDEEIIIYAEDWKSTDIGDYSYLVKDQSEIEDIGDDYYEVPIHD